MSNYDQSIAALPAITPTAGTPAPISAPSMVVQSVVIVADASNTGKVIVKDRSGNTMASIAAGQSFTPPIPMGGINLASIYLDASAASQQAYVTYASL